MEESGSGHAKTGAGQAFNDLSAGEGSHLPTEYLIPRLNTPTTIARDQQRSRSGVK
jgi:hypothetical protein